MKTIKTICLKPTRTLTKGKFYEIIPARRIHSGWRETIVTYGVNDINRSLAYVTNDDGCVVVVKIDRFKGYT